MTALWHEVSPWVRRLTPSGGGAIGRGARWSRRGHVRWQGRRGEARVPAPLPPDPRLARVVQPEVAGRLCHGGVLGLGVVHAPAFGWHGIDPRATAARVRSPPVPALLRR